MASYLVIVGCMFCILAEIVSPGNGVWFESLRVQPFFLKQFICNCRAQTQFDMILTKI